MVSNIFSCDWAVGLGLFWVHECFLYISKKWGSNLCGEFCKTWELYNYRYWIFDILLIWIGDRYKTSRGGIFHNF